jgi:hypothetical protein
VNFLDLQTGYDNVLPFSLLEKHQNPLTPENKEVLAELHAIRFRDAELKRDETQARVNELQAEIAERDAA